MRVLLTGIDCVGKTTIGLRLAELMGLGFFDLDMEIEQAAHHILTQLQAYSPQCFLI